MRLSHVNDRKSTGARDDDGNDDDPSNKGGSKRRALSMETAINTAGHGDGGGDERRAS
jgi:hypothetical protein